MKIWTSKANNTLFTLLPKQTINDKLVGIYHSDWSSTKPPHITYDEMDKVYDNIYDVMKKKRVFGKSCPKSSRAIAMQVAACLHPYKQFSTHRSRSLRLHAYLGGFLSISNICQLEQKEVAPND
jgi:hypothetical protein